MDSMVFNTCRLQTRLILSRYPTTPPGTTYPHHSLTCNVINGNQMLILVGTFPNATTCDSPAVYGFHNLDLSENNNQSAKWALFNNSKKGYTVPPEIVAVVGGRWVCWECVDLANVA
jgi:hypothetical protein